MVAASRMADCGRASYRLYTSGGKMNAIIFGASGMVGQSVLRECLLDADIKSVTAVTRTPLSVAHKKFKNVLHDNFLNFSPLGKKIKKADVCFYCLGVASAGLN